MTQQKSPVPADKKPEQQRREYRKPQLLIYGDVGAITGNVGSTGVLDGGSHPNKGALKTN
jgi:hypothetical protein